MGVMEVDTPTKPKSVTKKRKVEMKSSPAKKILESPKKSPKHVTIHEDVLKTPVRSSKRLGKKVVPIFDTPKNDSDESPTRKVHFAVVPGSDPFYSPKTESRVPDIQSPKPLFAQVCMINETVTRSRIRKVRPELVETIITESPTKRRSPRFLRI
jgi:CRISPR/Cas system-associated protein Cas5 (RAMP superfamily)